MTIALSGASLRWHLFVERIALLSFWLVSVQRVLLAALIVIGAPLLFSFGISALQARMARRPAILMGLPLLESLFVLVAAVVYVLVLSSRVTPSASGDQAAFLNWAQYCEREQLVQPMPDWARWDESHVGAYATLTSHFRIPAQWTKNGQDPDRAAIFVDDKPFGLPLLILLARTIGGEEASYFVSAWMAAVAVAALYGAARVSGLGVLTSVVGAASLAFDGEFVHSATVLDPDTPAAGWVAVFFFALLLLRRGSAWAVLAGAAIGMACLTRYNTALAFVLAAPFLMNQRRRVAPFLAGGAPVLVMLLVFNRLAYGGFLQFPYRIYVGHLAFEVAYWPTLWSYLKGFAADASPVFWLPFLAFPLLKRRPRFQRAGAFSVVIVWFAFFGAFGGWDTHFLRYLLPIYPVIIWGGLHVWNYVAGTARVRRLAFLGAMAALATLWTVPRALEDDSETGDTSRVAALWVDRIVPPSALLATDTLFNNAIYYYTDLRRFPATVDVRRPDFANLAALQRAAHATGHVGDWFLLVHDFWVGAYRSNYPELRLEEAASGPEWKLYRVTSVEDRDR